MDVVGADGIILNVDGLDTGACVGCCALTILDILRPLSTLASCADAAGDIGGRAAILCRSFAMIVLNIIAFIILASNR